MRRSCTHRGPDGGRFDDRGTWEIVPAHRECQPNIGYSRRLQMYIGLGALVIIILIILLLT